MRITEVTAEEYAKAFVAVPHVFCSAAFSDLNSHKVETVKYLLFVDGSKIRFGLTFGQSSSTLQSPFSAPFGGFVSNGKQGIASMQQASEALVQYAKDSGCNIVMTLPPAFYAQSEISKWTNILACVGTIRKVDVNYNFCLCGDEDYTSIIEHNAAKNLRRAMNAGLSLRCLNTTDAVELRRAYDVIARNRAEHSYKLSMSFNEVWQTTRLIEADAFVVEHKEVDVAAAIVFHVADAVWQVIYWGDIRESSSLRVMNYLAYQLFVYYRSKGAKILDIGPSTDNGMPNIGLCNFKESIGCIAFNKFTFDICPFRDSRTCYRQDL